MKIQIEPGGPVALDITAPGSKSLTNRALVCAALAPGESRLSHASFSDDSRILCQALRGAGLKVEEREAEQLLVVQGAGGRIPAGRGDFWMGNAGTALRFFTSLISLGRGTYQVDGDGRMRERPIGGLVEALRRLGARIEYRGQEGYPPLRIESEGLRGATVPVASGTSSQFVSSLLLSAPGATGAVELDLEGPVTSQSYIDMTLDVMRDRGVEVDRRGDRRYRIEAGRRYAAGDYAVGGDGASANYFFAMAATTGGRACVRGVGRRNRQGELRFLDVLADMGCEVRWGPDQIEVQGGPLRGVDVDLNEAPDSAQTLACVALFARGPTRVRNVSNLRVKETNRIAAIARECGKLGARVDEHPDGFTLTPGSEIRPAEIDTYRDHRMAMSFAVAAAAQPGIVIRDPECVSKSYPGFFESLESMGLKVRRL